MPSRDVQHFQMVARCIANDVAACASADYAYSRHIANPALQKTYGFTLETGPFIGNSPDSSHPDPTLIRRDTKAALLALLQQSICAIELIAAASSSAKSWR